jgi:hypothetical protein
VASKRGLVGTLWFTLASCQQSPPPSGCLDNLSGTWVANDTTAMQWHIIDIGTRADGFAVWPDFSTRNSYNAPTVMWEAPRHLELYVANSANLRVGLMRRRISAQDRHCEVQAPMRITSCSDKVLQVEMTDLPAVINVADCSTASTSATMRQQWQRSWSPR